MKTIEIKGKRWTFKSTPEELTFGNLKNLYESQVKMKELAEVNEEAPELSNELEIYLIRIEQLNELLIGAKYLFKKHCMMSNAKVIVDAYQNIMSDIRIDVDTIFKNITPRPQIKIPTLFGYKEYNVARYHWFDGLEKDKVKDCISKISDNDPTPIIDLLPLILKPTKKTFLDRFVNMKKRSKRLNINYALSAILFFIQGEFETPPKTFFIRLMTYKEACEVVKFTNKLEDCKANLVTGGVQVDCSNSGTVLLVKDFATKISFSCEFTETAPHVVVEKIKQDLNLR